MRSLSQQRAALAREVEDRHADLAEAKRRLDREDKVSRELLSPVHEFPRKDYSPARLREFTENLLAQLAERGLALGPADGAVALRVIDPAAREDFAAARERHYSAIRAVKQFDDAHAEDLQKEALAAEAARIRRTFEESQDPKEIRDALSGKVAHGNALTSADFRVASR